LWTKRSAEGVQDRLGAKKALVSEQTFGTAHSTERHASVTQRRAFLGDSK
jgi:hypothetical protein